MRENIAARFYELMVITTPEGTPEELVGVVDQITGYVESAGGTIIRTNYDSPWGRRLLSYPIRHESQDVRDGFYTLVHIELEPDKVVIVERDLKLNERLMRYLVLQLAGEPVFPEPPEEETEGEGGATVAASAKGAAPEAATTGEDGEAPAAQAESAAPEATTAVAEATVSEAETATSEDTAEERRNVVGEAGADSGEVQAEDESETSEETAEESAGPAAEITEVPADVEDDIAENKE
ncbi:hypothetical protein BH20CHL4_BH20CHL4_05100 [soil metagenome]